MTHEIQVHYRRADEKDFETHDIEAPDFKQALIKAKKLYTGLSIIATSYYYDGVKYKPKDIANFEKTTFQLTREKLFELTNPKNRNYEN